MNTIKFINKVLKEKLKDNDILLIKKITSFITCDDCDEGNIILHNHKIVYEMCMECCKECSLTKCIKCNQLFSDEYNEYKICNKCCC